MVRQGANAVGALWVVEKTTSAEKGLTELTANDSGAQGVSETRRQLESRGRQKKHAARAMGCTSRRPTSGIPGAMQNDEPHHSKAVRQCRWMRGVFVREVWGESWCAE